MKGGKGGEAKVGAVVNGKRKKKNVKEERKGKRKKDGVAIK